MKSLIKYLRFAGIGWVAGTLFIIMLGVLWYFLFPLEETALQPDPNNPFTLVLTLVSTSIITFLPGLIGGMVGGALPREGGSREQTIFAMLGGILASVPFACFNYWLLTT